MNISSASSNFTMLATPIVQGRQDTPSASTGCGAGGDERVAREQHRGGLGDAVRQALEGLGVSLGQPAGAPAPAAAAATPPAGSVFKLERQGRADDDSDASVRRDLHQFMHALFEAIKGESNAAGNGAATAAAADPAGDGAGAVAAASSAASSASGSNGGAGATPSTTAGGAAAGGRGTTWAHTRGAGWHFGGQAAGVFASRLSALVAQVGGGSAPAGLQSSFDKLMADAQGAAAAGTPAAGASSTPAATTASVTLLQFLAQLQQRLGYGATSAASMTGSLVSTNV